MSNNILVCNKICKQYTEDNNVNSVILKNISFEVKFGEMLAIIGNSGSGKSTLLRILGGLDIPTSGDVIIDGKLVSKFSKKERSLFRNRYLGFIHQFHYLLPDFNVLENVMLPVLIQNRSTLEAKKKSLYILEVVGLQQYCKYRPSQLSGGERQRVSIARALVNDPHLVLADEPTGSLDINRSKEIISFMKKLNNVLGTTFLIVTHNLHIARNLSRYIKIEDGIVQTTGTL